MRGGGGFAVSVSARSIRVSPGFVESSRSVSLEDAPNLIAHAAEDGKLLLLSAGRMCGVVESPMIAIHLAGEHRARLVSVSADGDDCLHLLLKEFAEVL